MLAGTIYILTNAPILISFDKIWDELKDAYNTDFKLLVHGEFPKEELIANKFKTIIQVLSK